MLSMVTRAIMSVSAARHAEGGGMVSSVEAFRVCSFVFCSGRSDHEVVVLIEYKSAGYAGITFDLARDPVTPASLDERVLCTNERLRDSTFTDPALDERLDILVRHRSLTVERLWLGLGDFDPVSNAMTRSGDRPSETGRRPRLHDLTRGVDVVFFVMPRLKSIRRDCGNLGIWNRIMSSSSLELCNSSLMTVERRQNAPNSILVWNCGHLRLGGRSQRAKCLYALDKNKADEQLGQFQLTATQYGHVRGGPVLLLHDARQPSRVVDMLGDQMSFEVRRWRCPGRDTLVKLRVCDALPMARVPPLLLAPMFSFKLTEHFKANADPTQYDLVVLTVAPVKSISVRGRYMCFSCPVRRVRDAVKRVSEQNLTCLGLAPNDKKS
nr:hypothetical protein CFP56_77241 [Quercus suber]